jgi:hypothetical protein
MRKKAKRILTDTSGYLLILAGIAFGWLPGPGGIPLILAGLGLLSIHNRWAKDLRDYLQRNGGKVIQIFFPKHRFVQLLYDCIVFAFLIIVAVLGWQHDAIWQVSLATALFFISLVIAGINRDRAVRIKDRLSRRNSSSL